MERKFKTGANNRENYVYYTANGSKIIIEPGKDGVDEEWIKKLHELDHQEELATRREDYATPVRIGLDYEHEYQTGSDKNPCLADSSTDPLEKLLESIAAEEHAEQLKKLTKALDCLTPLQKQTVYKKFYLGMSEIEIALEEGVDKSAISHRLKPIYAKLAKKLKK